MLLTSAIFLLYRRRKGGRISDAAISSFQESSFCEAPTGSHSLFFSRFHCDCGFLSIAFCLSVSTRQRVAGGQPTGDSDLQEASNDQRVDHVGGPTHGDEELQETSTGQRVDDVVDELLKESWKNIKGPTVPTLGTLIATYVRLKTEFEAIVAVEKKYSPGKVMAPIEDEEMAPGGMRFPGELHKVKNNGLLP